MLSSSPTKQDAFSATQQKKPEEKPKENTEQRPKKKPEWLRTHLNSSNNYSFIKNLVKSNRLATVCEEARCPNIGECWGEHKTATFMILGSVCTRRCRFCAVDTGLPASLDIGEPKRVADSVKQLKLEFVVITMVNRDELPDGGAEIVSRTVHAIRNKNPNTKIELLTSDFMGKKSSIDTVLQSDPDIMSHNVETVERLTPFVRSRSVYQRSLDVLAYCFHTRSDIPLKSSIMLGLGETQSEIIKTLVDLFHAGVRIVNIGQYLQPTKQHLPVVRYYKPHIFDELKERAYDIGFTHCESAPLVRSSYHASEQAQSFESHNSISS